MNQFIEKIPTEMAHIFRDGRGIARIDGMRTKVSQVVIDHLRLGLSPAEIHDAYPYLSLAQIHAALAYYYDHQEEIDDQIEASGRETDRLLPVVGTVQLTREKLEERLKRKQVTLEEVAEPV